MAGDLIDPRRREPDMGHADDRRMLEEWLEFQRTTLLLKVEGLTDEQRKTRPVAGSTMSLHGLVRHLSEVERWWFQQVLSKDPSSSPIWTTDASPDADWFPLDEAVWEDDLAVWQAACETSREIAGRHELTDVGEHPHAGPTTLRWIYVHMIEEYARHNGHADLVRELVDGQVGY
jgi:uncharacterized damage-inducible protein DinB